MAPWRPDHRDPPRLRLRQRRRRRLERRPGLRLDRHAAPARSRCVGGPHPCRRSRPVRRRRAGHRVGLVRPAVAVGHRRCRDRRLRSSAARGPARRPGRRRPRDALDGAGRGRRARLRRRAGARQDRGTSRRPRPRRLVPAGRRRDRRPGHARRERSLPHRSRPDRSAEDRLGRRPIRPWGIGVVAHHVTPLPSLGGRRPREARSGRDRRGSHAPRCCVAAPGHRARPDPRRILGGGALIVAVFMLVTALDSAASRSRGRTRIGPSPERRLPLRRADRAPRDGPGSARRVARRARYGELAHRPAHVGGPDGRRLLQRPRAV